VQYLILAYDGTDEKALERRMAARPAHVEGGDRMKHEGKLLHAVAILNDQEKMIGSAMVVDFPTREDVDHWLKNEPYVTGDVWRKIEVIPCRVGPSFSK
jgi:uncharacterized protein YciI